MIPSTVEVIERRTFMNCSRLVEVELWSGLRQIEDEAFYDAILLSASLSHQVSKK